MSHNFALKMIGKVFISNNDHLSRETCLLRNVFRQKRLKDKIQGENFVFITLSLLFAIKCLAMIMLGMSP